MLAKLWTIIDVIKGALALFKQVRKWVKESQKNEIDKQAMEREQAVEDLKKAQTKEEFLEAQKRISKNLP